jgi:uncharacterized protein YpiB (UPF0302 family)
MEVSSMEKMSMIYEALLELHAERVLDEALRRFQIKRLNQEIDFALQQGDQEMFLSLTNELNNLNYE